MTVMTARIFLAWLPLVVKAINIVQSNDDGWAEINNREFYNSLTSAGFSSIISAPAENESGTGSLDAPPTTVGSEDWTVLTEDEMPTQNGPLCRAASVASWKAHNKAKYDGESF